MKSRILEILRHWRERLRALPPEASEHRRGLPAIAPYGAWPAGLEGRIVAAGLFALVALVWLAGHDERVRRAGELAELRKQAATDVASLKAQVDAARREADQQNARAVRELEARQARLTQAGNELRERTATLQQQERAQVERVATLPTSEVATQVAARLGLPLYRTVRGLSAQELSRQGGLAPATVPSGSPASASQAAPTQAGAGAGSAGPGFRLDEPALRKVDAALIQLDACREQSTVLNQQVENCHAQTATEAELVRQESASIEKLHQALADQDQMIVQLKKQHAAELQAARGSRWRRFVSTLEHVALGVALGAVLR